MVHAAGIERLNEGTQHEVLSYNFFSSELFGIEQPIARIVEYFKSAASVSKCANASCCSWGRSAEVSRRLSTCSSADWKSGPELKPARFTRSKTVRCTRSRCISFHINCAAK